MADSGASSTSSSARRSLNFDALKNHVLENKLNSALWAIRVLTLVFALGYFLPIFGSASNAYYKVLIANAAISALRLHQRLGSVRLTKEFLQELLMEDSCHYLFYSFIFLYVRTVTVVIMPVVLFCVLHAASYSLTLLDTLGQNSWWGARLLISLVEFQSMNILRMIAFFEIALMPYTVVLILLGEASLLTPLIYYHFLMQRYTSRRNPYSKNMFRELRMILERTAARPAMPGFLRNILLGVVGFTSKLAPVQVQAPNQAQ